MDLTVQAAGNKSSKLQVADAVFGSDYNESLIHQVVNSYLHNARQGTSAQKSRSDVRGGGAKPWRQKGTGRARAGTSRSPIWRSGGVTFAKRTRDFNHKVNKKMYRSAMRSILSELVRLERLMVVESLSVSAPKTKEMVKFLDEFKLTNVLIITDAVDKDVYLAARNIPRVTVCDVAAIDPVSLITYDNVLLTSAAVKQFEEMLG